MKTLGRDEAHLVHAPSQLCEGLPTPHHVRPQVSRIPKSARSGDRRRTNVASAVVRGSPDPAPCPTAGLPYSEIGAVGRPAPNERGRTGTRPYRFAFRSTLFAFFFPHRLSLHAPRFTLYALLPLLFLIGCASPRVVEVSSRTRLQNIDSADLYLFGHDKASRIRYQPSYLPPDEQGEEFYVHWRPSTVSLVKFEYRQLDKPNEVHVLTYTPHGNSSTTFAIHDEDFRSGEAVSAWRVTLWAGDTLLTERKSTLW
jgi:hypothetical protein